MKLLPLILLNVAIVVVAIVVYDQVRGDATTAGAPAETAAPDLTDLEDRIQAIEDERLLYLKDQGTDPRVFERLAALEASRGMPAPERVADEREPIRDEPGIELALPGDPSPEELAKFRELQAAARRDEAIKRNRARVSASLDKLGLNLTEDQTEKIHAAYADFQPRLNQIWTVAKTQARETHVSGGRIDRQQFYADTMGVIQGTFAESLAGVVHPADAESIAEALHPIKR